MSKQYGLIVPGKAPTGAMVKRPAIFDEDSDSDDEIERPTGLQTALKRQDRITQEKAVEEDPTVYQYDEIYDDMEQKRKESKLSRKDLDKKPKYIGRLLDTANRRKQENERRIERQIQKEREAEGDEFKDKEAFVTMAYRKKLEEMKKQEEEEKREEYLEAIGDVTKQGNLDGFYRHLYDQKVNYDDEKPKDDDGEASTRKRKTSTNVRERKYRKRDDSNSEDEAQETKPGHLPSNLDADSDFSIDSDSDESNAEEKSSKEVAPQEEKTETRKEEAEDAKSADVVVETDDVAKEGDQLKPGAENEAGEEEAKPKKPKIDIWKKRTVDAVFEEALQRYFERKALREAGV